MQPYPEEDQRIHGDMTPRQVELLRGFFKFYSQEIDFNHDALLLWDAKTVSQTSLAGDSHYGNCKIGEMTVINPFDMSHNVADNVNAKFCPYLATEMKRAAKISAYWETKRPSYLVDASKGLAGLFELADLEANEEARMSGAKEHETDQRRPVVGGMKGEQENGEFYIILPMTKATLKSEEFLKEARKKDLTPQHYWLHLAQDLVIKILKEVFSAELTEAPFTLNYESTAATNSMLMSSSLTSTSITIRDSTYGTVTFPPPQISLQCTCRHQVWQGRKNRKRKLKEELNLSGTFIHSLAFEKKVTERFPSSQAEKHKVEFSCYLMTSDGRTIAHDSKKDSRNRRSHLLIRLHPSQSYLEKFKPFYKQFRSVVIQLNMFELNVTKVKNPYKTSFGC
ncbi:hypothetical protein PoB_002799200 [Plakobranchus ocellatus]|uniref:PAP-associated domain-containing protein n=1 Tax=Plakobranchus ocellatus TaxID=259542 RepID=A0AAV4A3P3_9GAST|nr:hypothetical protein PoB_002799200 [Plakobranchus ocellatus]